MPRWLQAWIAISLFCVWSAALLVAVPALMSYATKAGEPSFTDDERARLIELMPAGEFRSAGEFVNCEGGRWMHYTPTHDVYWLASERRCWR